MEHAHALAISQPSRALHLSKRAPQRALSSTVHADPARVQSDPEADPGKIRLRDAYQSWANVVDGSREMFAEALGVNFSEVKRGLSPSDDRPVRGDLILAAETLAAEARSPVTDAQLGAAVRHLVQLIFAATEAA